MNTSKECETCHAPLDGRQRRFCSRHCKNRDTNVRHQNYANQRERGLRRKLASVEAAGGACMRCGYRKNLAGLTWHHREPEQKAFELDARSFSNRRMTTLRAEIAKCDLLCANCHAEAHWPQHQRP